MQHSGGKGGWLLMPPEDLPGELAERGSEMLMVPLLPDEAERLLPGDEALARTTAEEVRMLHLIAQGLSTKAVARELGISTRSVQRRLARLRRRFGLEPRADPALYLAQRGF